MEIVGNRITGTSDMAKRKHTIGPWKADINLGCKRISAKPFSKQKQAKRYEVATTPGMFNEAEDKANALLIAAAPEMLEALEIAEEVLRKGVPTLTTIECVTHLQAIIHKATIN